MTMNSVGPKSGEDIRSVGRMDASTELSQPAGSSDLHGRKVAILAALGADVAQITAVMAALKQAGALAEIVSTTLGPLGKAAGAPVATRTFFNTADAAWDGVYVPGGAGSISTLTARGDAAPFVVDAFRRAKTIGGTAEGADFVEAAIAADVPSAKTTGPLAGVVLARDAMLGSFPEAFVAVLASQGSLATE